MTRHSLVKLSKGKAVGSQRGFSETFNWIVDWFKRTTATNGVKITDRGDRWVIELDAPPSSGGGGGGIPAGYAEGTVVTNVQLTSDGLVISKATGLIKTGTGTTSTIDAEVYGP